MPVHFLVLFLFGGIGFSLMLAGGVVLACESRKKKRCTAITSGHIVGYSFLSGFPSPIVEYNVEGVAFRAKRRFRAVVTVTKSGFLSQFQNAGEFSVYVSENDVVHLHRGAVINRRAAAQTLYPLGASLPVFYNAARPQQAYVEKIPQKRSIVALVFLYTGAGLILLGAALAFLFA